MATTTPLNGWPVPTSTDYVKDGAVAIEALGDAIDTSVGSGLLAWQTWAPTLSSGWANGNGVWDAVYCQVGKTVHVSGIFIIGTTTTKGTQMICSLPVTAKNSLRNALGSAYFTIGGNQYPNFIINASTTTFQLIAANSAGTNLVGAGVTATVPGTWATNDVIRFAFTYEAA